MPLFTAQLNRMADALVDAAGTIWLHTAQPTDADPTEGRTNSGGGAYESGLATTPGTWIAAVNGDINNSAALNFGTASADVGTLTHWSYLEGTDAVAWGTLPSTQVNNGDSFSINAGSLQMNGATT